jgi:hypothetical protein
VSGKHLGKLFAIGRAKGDSPTDVKRGVKDQAHTGVDEMSGQEASLLILRLNALSLRSHPSRERAPAPAIPEEHTREPNGPTVTRLDLPVPPMLEAA